jgi:hypothetical protein
MIGVGPDGSRQEKPGMFQKFRRREFGRDDKHLLRCACIQTLRAEHGFTVHMLAAAFDLHPNHVYKLLGKLETLKREAS